MFIPIESILKGHGVKKGAGGGLSGYFEARHITKATGRRFTLPTQHCNPKRDAMVLFLNGTYQRPGADFAIVDDEMIEFAQPVTDAEIAVLSFKDVLPRPPLLYGSLIEDASIMLRKLSPFMQTVLKNPVERDVMDERIGRLEEAIAALDVAKEELEQVAMYWSVRERTSGGIVFGDDFYMAPLNVRLDETSTTIPGAVNVGQSSITVASAAGFRVGHEVSVYDDVSIERRKITAITGDTLTFSSPFTLAFRAGAGLARSMGRRDPLNGRLVLTDWVDPTDDARHEVYEHDMRFLLPPNDRFVLWVDALGAVVDGAVAFSTAHRLEAAVKTDGGSHFVWKDVGPDGVSFDVTTAGGVVGDVFVRLNGERLTTVGTGAGAYNYLYDTSALAAGDNTLEFVAMNDTLERVATIGVFKTPDETTVPLTRAVAGTETQFNAYHDTITDVMFRLSVTRETVDVAPVVTRFSGAIDAL